MEKYDAAEVGRSIGWTMAMYGQVPPIDAPLHIVEGYKAGRAHFPNPARPDRYHTKWLQLCRNAYARGRIVQKEITPEFIKLIDYATCPVTLETLTHGTRTDTDWSVDRVNNDGAYADGNVIVMSTRANKAKGNKSYADVRALAFAGEHSEGLSGAAWMRLLVLMFGPTHPGATYIEPLVRPLRTRIPNRSTRHKYHELQHVVLKSVRNSSLRNRWMKALHKHNPSSVQRANLDSVYHRLGELLKVDGYEYDALADSKLQEWLWGWYFSLPPLQRAALGGTLNAAAGGTRLTTSQVDGWSLATRGYSDVK